MSLDYTESASSYLNKFLGQARNNTAASVSNIEHIDRDNLLHFIENNFQSNQRAGITAENLRAILHAMVKSSISRKDDIPFHVLMNTSFRISTGAANRFYFGSQTYGWDSDTWSQYITSNLSSTTLPSVPGFYSNMGIDTPFEICNFTIYGSILNQASTGDVDVKVYYCDMDDSASANLQNMTFLCETTVPCAVSGTSYFFKKTVAANVKIPMLKKIFIFIRNTGHGGVGTETLRITLGSYFTKRSSGYTP